MVIGQRKVRKHTRLQVGTHALSLLLAVTGQGCNKKPPSQGVSADISRSGRTLSPTGFKYTDQNASLSANGSKVVFISGRDTSPSQSILKAYKVDWAGSQAPGPAQRVTSSDIGFEREAVVSPDGNWVLLAALKDNQVDIYLQDYAGQVSPVAVTADAKVETQLAFSPDSKMISWLSTDPTTGATKVGLATIGGGTAQDVGTTVALPTGEDHVDRVFWVPTSAGTSTLYQMATASASSTVSGASDFKKYGFNDLASVSDARSSVWLSGLRSDITLAPALTSTKAVFGESLTDSEDEVSQMGTGATQSPKVMIPLQTAPVFAGVDGEASLSRYGYTQGASNPPPGFSVRSLSLTADGSSALIVTGVYYRCAADSTSVFGTALVWAPTDSVQAFSYLSPKLKAQAGDDSTQAVEAYEYAATNMCDDRSRSDGSTARIDDQIISASLNNLATTQIYRAVYVTRATTMLDQSCGVVAGDTEVWALDATSSSKTFYPISQNHDPSLTTNNRLKQGSCRL